MILSTKEFGFSCPTKIEYGRGLVKRLNDKIQQLGKHEAIVATDPGVAKAGLIDPIVATLKEMSIPTQVFAEVESNPRGETCDRVAALVKNPNDVFFIAVGGGSSIDTVKAAIVTVAHGGKTLDYQRGRKPVTKPCPPFIAIPTTAGTGAEVTPWAVITDTSQKKKVVIFGNQTWPTMAILDPELTLSLPPKLTAETGMDALTHLIEAFTSTYADPLTQALTIKGIEMVGKWLRKAVANPNDLEARANMLVASMLGGLALNYAGLGAVHACSHPLGAFYDIGHGVANAIMLPVVMKFNMIGCPELYKEVARALGVNVCGMNDYEAAEAAVEAVCKLNEDIGIPKNLKELGVPESELEELGRAALKETSNLCSNPRVPSEEQLINIFKSAYYGE
ncbi:MAG: iron-containing alcohol dehydrogenase [Thermacetogeniaceae bacterium]